MKLTRNQAGFSHILIIFVILLVAVIGFAGWRLLSHKDAEGAAATSVAEKTTTEQPARSLTQTTLPNEKLSLSYDASYWKKSEQASGTNSCGKTDSLTLTHGDFNLNLSFGACGKGGDACFADPASDCREETTGAGEVKLSGDQGNKFIVVHAISTDAGTTWSYDLSLTDTGDCAGLCSFTARNVEQKTATFTLINSQYRPDKTGTMSQEKFLTLPEVKAAVAVMKTARY